jgi:translocation and assembly module TamB
MRYGGPADALWRLMALDNFDLTGPIDIAADMSGSSMIRNSRLAGGQWLRLQSAVTGTDISQIWRAAAFRPRCAEQPGRADGWRAVVGSGMVDLAAWKAGAGPPSTSSWRGARRSSSTAPIWR